MKSVLFNVSMMFICCFVIVLALAHLLVHYFGVGRDDWTPSLTDEGCYISPCQPNTGEVADFMDRYCHEWRGMRWIVDHESDMKCLTDCEGVQQSCKPIFDGPEGLKSFRDK